MSEPVVLSGGIDGVVAKASASCFTRRISSVVICAIIASICSLCEAEGCEGCESSDILFLPGLGFSIYPLEKVGKELLSSS